VGFLLFISALKQHSWLRLFGGGMTNCIFTIIVVIAFAMAGDDSGAAELSPQTGSPTAFQKDKSQVAEREREFLDAVRNGAVPVPRATTPHVIVKSGSADTRVFRCIEQTSEGSQERFWIRWMTNEWMFEFDHYVDITRFKTEQATRDAWACEDEIYSHAHKVRGQTAFSIQRNQTDALKLLIGKYRAWIAIAQKEDLSSGIEKELGNVGTLKFKFRTPDRLALDQWWLDSKDVDNFLILMETLPEMDLEMQEKLNDRQATHLAEVLKKAEVEAKKRAVQVAAAPFSSVTPPVPAEPRPEVV
jgi:hypothetical protein